MLDKAGAVGVAKQVYFLDQYKAKHDMLPPSITRLLPFEHTELPNVSQLREHLEHANGSAWAQTWGRKTFFDKTPRIVGMREREIGEYVQQLLLKKIIDIHEAPVHFNELGERKDGCITIAAKHVTEWGRPLARLWFLGPQLAEVRLEFQREPQKHEEEPAQHPRITRRPELFARRLVSLTEPSIGE